MRTDSIKRVTLPGRATEDNKPPEYLGQSQSPPSPKEGTVALCQIPAGSQHLIKIINHLLKSSTSSRSAAWGLKQT